MLRVRLLARFILSPVSVFWVAARTGVSDAFPCLPDLDSGDELEDRHASEDEFTYSHIIGQGDSSATGLTSMSGAAPPPGRPLSDPQLQFRTEVHDVVRSAFSSASAPGAIRSYEVLSKTVSPDVATKSGFNVIPTDR